MKARLDREMPELATFFSSGSLMEAVLNMGMQAPIDIQVAGTDQKAGYAVALDMMSQIRRVPDVADVFIPQDIDNPALQLDIDRVRAGELGLSEKEVVGNVITALTSNQMIAPNIWIDPRNNNNYFLNVQYPEGQIRSLADLRAIPLRGPKLLQPTRLDMVSRITRIEAPTEVDHYPISRTLDIYVRPHGQDLGRIADAITKITARTNMPAGIDATLRGSVEAMRLSLRSLPWDSRFR
jgi:multidrug efflux pump subunit AcrB